MLTGNDRWAITETLSLLGHLVDDGDLDRLGEVFIPQVSYDMSAVGFGVFQGIETVRDQAQQMERAGVGPLAHHVTNVVILREADDEVTTRSKVLMLMRNGALRSATQVDTLRRHDGGWQISHRVITPPRTASGGAHQDES